MDKPEEMSDIIFFAIKASRTQGKERVHYLKRLKELCKAELEYEKAKLGEIVTQISLKISNLHLINNTI